MILRSLWVFIKSFLVILSLYSFLWYITGQYVKINLKNILKEYCNNQADVSADSISFSGYPFKFIYKVKNLKISFSSAINNVADLRLDAVTFTSNFLMDSIKIDLDDPMAFSTHNNRFNYSVKWDEGARMNFKFTNSLLLDVLSRVSPSSKFNYFAYFDSGYNIFDKNLDKIVFISTSNKIRMEINDQEGSTKYSFNVAMDGEGGVDSHKDVQGEHTLMVDLFYNVPNTRENKEFELQINKFALYTEKYEVSAFGSVASSEKASNISKLDIDIKNRTNFLSTVGNVLSPELVSALTQIVPEVHSNKKDKADNVSFTISPSYKSYWIIRDILAG